MALFRWVLLLVGVGVIAGVFAYSRGWLSLARFTNPLKQRALAKRVAREEQLLAEEQQEETSDESPEPVEPSPPPLLKRISKSRQG